MTPIDSLRRQLRATQIALALLAAVPCLLAATPGGRALIVDSLGNPTTTLNLSGSHVTGLPSASVDGTPISPSSIGAASGGGASSLQVFPGAGQPITLSFDGTFSYLRASQFVGTTGGSVYSFSGTSKSFGPAGLDLLPADALTWRDGNFGTADVGLARTSPYNLQLTDGGGGGNGGYGNLTVGLLTSQFGISSDNGAIYSDGYGSLTIGDSLSVSQSASIGSVYAGSLTVINASSLDDGAIFTNGYGGMTVSGAMNLNGGLGLFGHGAAANQPATPTTLPQVITVLQAYGLCQ